MILPALLAEGCISGVRIEAAIASASATLVLSADGSTSDADDAALRLAVVEAHTRFATSLAGIDSDPVRLRRSAYVRLVSEGRPESAALLEPAIGWNPEDVELTEAWIRLRIETGRQAEARELAWTLAASDPEQRDRWIGLQYDAWRSSPEFGAGVVTLAPGIGIDALRPFRGSSAVIMRVVEDDTVTGVFKPDQRLRHQYHRGEVATYRLCLLLGCNVEIPQSDEVRLLKDDFVDLLGAEPDSIEVIASRNRELRYVSDPFGLEWIHGVRKSWVPSFCRFPIEYVSVWEPWVDGSRDLDAMRGQSPLAAIERIRGLVRANVDEVLAELGDADVAVLAHQLSDLHVLDYLTNNYDRYQPEQFLGMNLQFSDGQFISIDNGASFPTEDAHTDSSVWYRLQRVEVFSRQTIDALRWMNVDAAYGVLFEESAAEQDDTSRWAAFAQRRERLLAYVDGLIAERGESAVLIFE